MADKSISKVDGVSESLELPVYEGTIGPDVIDVRSLTAQGLLPTTQAFMSTAATESKITYIDGGKGILLHRGYPIEQLAEQSDYLELCYLLFHGELPTPNKEKIRSQHHHHTMVNDQLREFLKVSAVMRILWPL